MRRAVIAAGWEEPVRPLLMREHVLVALSEPDPRWQEASFWTEEAARRDIELSASVLVVRRDVAPLPAAPLPAAVTGLFRMTAAAGTETGLRRAALSADREACGSRVITDFDTALMRCNAARRDRRTIVFTNGVFDMLHLGHVRLLKAVAALGDFLVVGINSDQSARLLKGRERPVVPQFARAELVAAVRGVNLCVIFDQPDPTALLGVVRPAVLAKGGEYSLADVAGRDLVEKNGGRVVLIPHVEGWSASEVITRVRRGKA